MVGGASCAQEGTHYHDDGGEGSHRDDDNDDQDVIVTTANTCFTSRKQTGLDAFIDIFIIPDESLTGKQKVKF